MIEIMTAEVIARETLKNTLETEIPIVNGHIQAAKEKGNKCCFIDREFSIATRRMLEKAGYEAETDRCSTSISWEGVYNRLMDNEELVEELYNEIGIKIVGIENKNVIDPKWTSKKED